MIHDLCDLAYLAVSATATALGAILGAVWDLGRTVPHKRKGKP